MPKISPQERKKQAEEHAANAELTRERAEAIRTRRMQSQLSLALARRELIPKSLVQNQAGFVFAGLRAKILAIPQSYSRRLTGIADYETMASELKKMSHSILNELQDFPEKITNPDWLRTLEKEQTSGAAPKSQA